MSLPPTLPQGTPERLSRVDHNPISAIEFARRRVYHGGAIRPKWSQYMTRPIRTRVAQSPPSTARCPSPSPGMYRQSRRPHCITNYSLLFSPTYLLPSSIIAIFPRFSTHHLLRPTSPRHHCQSTLGRGPTPLTPTGRSATCSGHKGCSPISRPPSQPPPFWALG